jgi:signal transduction histidine kinase
MNDQEAGIQPGRLMDRAPVVVIKLDSSGRCIFINRTAESVFSRRMDECLGLELYKVFGYESQENFGCNAALQKALNGEDDLQCQITLKNGTGNREYILTFTPSSGAHEKDRGVYVVAVDISSLQEVFESFQQSMRIKEQFIAILAHELRNPLAALLSGLKVLELAPDEAQATKTREMMERQLKHLSRLVNDLLDVTRIKKGKIELIKTKTSLHDVFTLALDFSGESVKKNNHSLKVSVPEEPIKLHVDVNRLAQIVSNLIDNSSKYTPPGGKISLAASVEGDDLVISVSDNGVGIPADRLSQIFEAYAQLEESRLNFGGGLGIGLFLVKMMAQAHGGSVSVRSDGNGKGSEFTVRIPVAAQK